MSKSSMNSVSTLGEVLKNDASVGAGSKSTNRERFTLRGFDLDSSSATYVTVFNIGHITVNQLSY
ncbi:hypothetical protein OK016_23230 [Vibrio chagasii]|nr:hypothetical protein [Vibrio chagasii]